MVQRLLVQIKLPDHLGYLLPGCTSHIFSSDVKLLIEERRDQEPQVFI